MRRAKWAIFGLKIGQRRDVRGNVAPFGAMSRRSGQRRDVTEKDYANVATFRATSRRSRECY